MNTLHAALNYAGENNFSVIPLQKDKRPCLKWRVFQNRKATAEEIKKWWKKWPGAMIGIVTGRISKLFVIDCDTPEGFQAVQEHLPDTLCVPTARTPRGGWHLFFRYPENSGLTIGAGLLPGVDIRGQGGYITAAPSVNASGRAYRWMTGLSLADTAPPPVPDALLSALYNNSTIYRGDDKTQSLAAPMFAFGRRDEDLFHTAHCLTKGGMPKEEISQVLEKLIISWGEQPDPKWIAAKTESAMLRAERKERNLTQEIREWVMSTNGHFESTQVNKELQLSTRREMKTCYEILSRLCTGEHPLLEKYSEKRGVYRRIENEIAEVDFLNAPTDEFPLNLPLGIEEFCKLYPGNIVIVAGSKSAGKTAFLLNIVRDNMRQNEIIYLNSEMGDTEFRKRLELFGMPLKNWTFHPYHRAGNFADLITPERKIFIIDFLEVTNDFWKVAELIRQIHNKLKDGICIIALQKPAGRDSGRGGDFSKEKSRLYISLDHLKNGTNQLKIVDAKAWRTETNPRGMTRNYKLVQGSRFRPDGNWKE